MLPPIEAQHANASPPQDLPDRAPHHSRSASVGRMQKIQGPFKSREQIDIANAKANNLFRSCQSASPYYAVEHQEKLDARLSKLTRVAPVDFNPVGHMPIG